MPRSRREAAAEVLRLRAQRIRLGAKERAQLREVRLVRRPLRAVGTRIDAAVSERRAKILEHAAAAIDPNEGLRIIAKIEKREPSGA